MRRFRSLTPFLMGWLVVFLASPLLALAGPPVYVDGVLLRGTGVTYSKVDVEIAPDGAIHIRTNPQSTLTQPVTPSGSNGQQSLAPPVAPSSVAPSSVAPSSVAPSSVAPSSVAPSSVAPVPLEGRYWLAIQDRDAKASGMTVTLSLNGKAVGQFGGRSPSVLEVTSYLLRGDNSAVFQFSGTAGAEGAVLECVLAPGKLGASESELSLGYPILVVRRPAGTGGQPPEELHFVLPPPVLP